MLMLMLVFSPACVLTLTRLPADMDAESLFAAIAKIEMSSKHQTQLEQLAAGATS